MRLRLARRIAKPEKLKRRAATCEHIDGKGDPRLFVPVTIRSGEMMRAALVRSHIDQDSEAVTLAIPSDETIDLNKALRQLARWWCFLQGYRVAADI